MTTEAVSPAASTWFKTFLVGRNPRFTLVRIAVLVVTVVVLFRFVVIGIEVVGVSMEPNFVEGQIHLVNRLAYRKMEPQRGDVVAVRMKREHAVLLKRIIGLPGEHISFYRQKIYVNGQPLAEPYVRRRTHWSWSGRECDVPKDRYLVIGDNRSMRFADHFHYFAEKDEILGKVAF